MTTRLKFRSPSTLDSAARSTEKKRLPQQLSDFNRSNAALNKTRYGITPGEPLERAPAARALDSSGALRTDARALTHSQLLRALNRRAAIKYAKPSTPG